MLLVHEIQEAHPLKQGLKLYPTRIYEEFCRNSRGASTKTRIETQASEGVNAQQSKIQEAHPLKQGLKRSVVVIFDNTYF